MYFFFPNNIRTRTTIRWTSCKISKDKTLNQAQSQHKEGTCIDSKCIWGIVLDSFAILKQTYIVWTLSQIYSQLQHIVDTGTNTLKWIPVYMRCHTSFTATNERCWWIHKGKRFKTPSDWTSWRKRARGLLSVKTEELKMTHHGSVNNKEPQ